MKNSSNTKPETSWLKGAAQIKGIQHAHVQNTSKTCPAVHVGEDPVGPLGEAHTSCDMTSQCWRRPSSIGNERDADPSELARGTFRKGPPKRSARFLSEAVVSTVHPQSKGHQEATIERKHLGPTESRTRRSVPQTGWVGGKI